MFSKADFCAEVKQKHFQVIQYTILVTVCVDEHILKNNSFFFVAVAL